MAEAKFPPPGATDCHVHVIGPKRRYPLPADARYTPMDAPVGQLAAMLKRLGLERVVIVQPSFYGTDNTCLLDAMAELGNARGVAVLPDEVAAGELDALDDQGVRGLRVNIATYGTAPRRGHAGRDSNGRAAGGRARLARADFRAGGGAGAAGAGVARACRSIP